MQARSRPSVQGAPVHADLSLELSVASEEVCARSGDKEPNPAGLQASP